jgi:hypothetical protein
MTTTPRTLTNDRTGRSIQTAASNAELLTVFAETAPGNHWLWFWLADHHQKNTLVPSSQGKAEMREFLADSFLLAAGMGLKNPMIRLKHGDWRYKIYLSKAGNVCFKAGRLHAGTTKPDGDEEYMGCLVRGQWKVNDRRKMLDPNISFMEELEADPPGLMARCSKDMGRCCYCNQPLEDQRSKDAGYGETCAERWGLPWGTSYDEKVPSFAQVWAGAIPGMQQDIRAVCKGIRENPNDTVRWAILADALEEAGLPHRPKVPPYGAKLPAP